MDPNKLKADIVEILKDADLSQLSAKKIRLQLEEKYKVDLSDKKSEIDSIVMSEIDAIMKSKNKPKQSSSSQKKKSNKKRKKGSSDDDDDDDDEVDEKEDEDEKDVEMLSDDEGKAKADGNTEDDEDIARQLQEEEENGAVRKTRHAHKKKTAGKSEKKEKKPRKKGAPRENRFTETCNLSPELAAIMGEDKLKRSDVVKRMWAIARERNLFDPKNKRFMICDEQMLSVFGKKKILMFGMMKYLSSHIYKSEEVILSS